MIVADLKVLSVALAVGVVAGWFAAGVRSDGASLSPK